MGIVWPIYKKSVYPTRAIEDYRDAKTRIYVETEIKDGVHAVIIGSESFQVPSQVQNGQVGFLTSLSSAVTEVVYLGEYWKDEEHRTTKRTEFYQQHGFADAAQVSIQMAFDGPSIANEDLVESRASKSWADLSASEKQRYLKVTGSESAATAVYKNASEKEDNSYFRFMSRQLAISRIILGSGSDGELRPYLPVQLRYPEAWKAYVEYYEHEQVSPPQWLFEEFLVPLGFDKRVVNIKH